MKSLTTDERAAIARRLADTLARLDRRADEWFPEQRGFYTDPARLVAALCSRRAGKTRGGCLAMLKAASRTKHGRFLYINSTKLEARKLAWIGANGDGMKSLAIALGLDVVLNETTMSIHFPAIDSWIYLMGADDEAGIRGMLGLPYDEVWWDEAQKIPVKLTRTIMRVLIPSLADRKGRLRLTGTPTPSMQGLFYDVTRTDGKALKGWSVHRWNLLDNPFWGATREERQASGIDDIRAGLGDADGPAPMDHPDVQREALGVWVSEDALYIYDANHVTPRSRLIYAPVRTKSLELRVLRMNGDVAEWEEVALARFPDLELAMADLPGFTAGRHYFFAMAADIGWSPDPFTISVVAWSLVDPVLYELASWGSTKLDQPTQFAVLRHCFDTVRIGHAWADAGGSVGATIKGWSLDLVKRYGVPLIEVDKHPGYKKPAIAAMNGDIRRGLFLFREGSPLLAELATLQWMINSKGERVENPAIPNDHADAGLYAHRGAYHHRGLGPPTAVPVPGSPEHAAAVERAVLQEAYAREEDDLEVLWS